MDGLRRKTAKAIALTLFALALVGQGSSPALADQPLTDTLQIDNTYTADSLCSFPVVVHEEGALRSSLFFGRDGQVNRITENWQGVRSSLTNPQNGRSISYRTAGRDGFTIENDGGLTVFRQGVRGIITIPGLGAISGEAGNVTIRITQGGLDVRRSGFLRESDYTPVCSYLQGAP